MRKTFSILLICISMLASTSLQAEPQVIGQAAANSKNAATKRWQSWGFAIGALIIVAAGLTALALNHGSHAHAH